MNFKNALSRSYYFRLSRLCEFGVLIRSCRFSLSKPTKHNCISLLSNVLRLLLSGSNLSFAGTDTPRIVHLVGRPQVYFSPYFVVVIQHNFGNVILQKLTSCVHIINENINLLPVNILVFSWAPLAHARWLIWNNVVCRFYTKKRRKTLGPTWTKVVYEKSARSSRSIISKKSKRKRHIQKTVHSNRPTRGEIWSQSMHKKNILQYCFLFFFSNITHKYLSNDSKLFESLAMVYGL